MYTYLQLLIGLTLSEIQIATIPFERIESHADRTCDPELCKVQWII